MTDQTRPWATIPPEINANSDYEQSPKATAHQLDEGQTLLPVVWT